MLAPFNEKQHLWIVMNDECAAGQCLLLMVTSVYPTRKSDESCLLNIGDHPFIMHPSYIAYRLAQMPRAQHIRKMLASKFYIPKEDFSGPVFARIAGGIFTSDEASGAVQKYAAAIGLD